MSSRIKFFLQTPSTVYMKRKFVSLLPSAKCSQKQSGRWDRSTLTLCWHNLSETPMPIHLISEAWPSDCDVHPRHERAIRGRRHLLWILSSVRPNGWADTAAKVFWDCLKLYLMLGLLGPLHSDRMDSNLASLPVSWFVSQMRIVFCDGNGVAACLVKQSKGAWFFLSLSTPRRAIKPLAL